MSIPYTFDRGSFKLNDLKITNNPHHIPSSKVNECSSTNQDKKRVFSNHNSQTTPEINLQTACVVLHHHAPSAHKSKAGNHDLDAEGSKGSLSCSSLIDLNYSPSHH